MPLLTGELEKKAAFMSAQDGASKNALQPSHRGWKKPRLASGRSPDLRFSKAERLPEDLLSGRALRPGSDSPRLQLLGSGGFAPRFPNSRYIWVIAGGIFDVKQMILFPMKWDQKAGYRKFNLENLAMGRFRSHRSPVRRKLLTRNMKRPREETMEWFR